MIPTFLIIFVIALAAVSVGFVKFSYFVSTGYGGSVACMALGLLAVFKGNLTFGTVILCILLMTYGIRLASFTYLRQKNSATYKEKVKNVYKQNSDNVSIATQISMWLFCALLYFCEISPVYYTLKNGKSDGLFTYCGIIIAAIGVYFESMGDYQKSAAKKKDPSRFCDTGLYALCRCPNYFGEISFWTGIFISGVCALSGPLQWIASCLGYVSILGIMFSSTSSLEARQYKSYGKDEKYQQYIKTTPILIPFVPIYTVGGAKAAEKEAETSKSK